MQCEQESHQFVDAWISRLIEFVNIGMLDEHLKFIAKTSGRREYSRGNLAEVNVDKSVAGKKGSTYKHWYRPTSEREKSATAPDNEADGTNQQHTELYSEIYHNDNPFVLCLLPKEAKLGKGCNYHFCHRQRMPHDLVLEHKERYFLPHWRGLEEKNKRLTRRHRAITMLIQVVFNSGSPISLRTTSKYHKKLKTFCASLTSHT